MNQYISANIDKVRIIINEIAQDQPKNDLPDCLKCPQFQITGRFQNSFRNYGLVEMMGTQEGGKYNFFNRVPTVQKRCQFNSF